jgi:hypothetical protein
VTSMLVPRALRDARLGSHFGSLETRRKKTLLRTRSSREVWPEAQCGYGTGGGQGPFSRGIAMTPDFRRASRVQAMS